MLAESEPVPGSVIAIAGPHAVEALELLVVGDRGDRGVAEALARHREQQADVAPAHLDDATAPRRGWRRSCCRSSSVGLVVAAYAGGAGAADRAGLGEPVDHRGEHVELLGVLVLGEVVLARDRPQHVHRDLVGLADERPELLRGLEVDRSSDEHRAFHDADGSEVAVPPLDRVLLDEAVAAEQLHAVEADLHALARRTAGGPARPRGRSPCPGGAARPPCRSRSRIACSSIAMSATMNATDWRLAIGSPNASRSLT